MLVSYVAVFALTILMVLILKSIPHEIGHAMVLRKLGVTPGAVILFCKTRKSGEYVPIEEPVIPLSFSVGRCRVYLGYCIEENGCTTEEGIRDDIGRLDTADQVSYLGAGSRGEVLFCLTVALSGLIATWWSVTVGAIIACAALVMVATVLVREVYQARHDPESDAGRIRAIRSGGTPYDYNQVHAT